MAQNAVQRRALKLKQANRRRRGRVPPLRRVPRQRHNQLNERRHERDLELVAKRLGDIIEQFLLPALPGLVPARVDGGTTARMDQTELERLLRSLFQLFVVVSASDSVANRASRVGRLQNAFNRGEVERQFQHVLGISLDDEVFPRRVIQQFVDRNARLITRMGRQEIAKIGDIISEGIRAGKTSTTLGVEIQERLGVSRRRAKFIARDQLSKLNAQLNEQRHKSIGVTGYIWRTSDDEKVRPGHAALDDREFNYRDPPIVDARSGRRANPGEDFNCRCTAEPKLEQAIAMAEAA